MLPRLLYGLLFVVVVPAGLIRWAAATAVSVPLPVSPRLWPGGIAVGAGLVLMASGMAALAAFGRGLPMNAFPPPRYVSRGIYRLTSHPIYVGFVLCCFGVSILMQSSSGVWLVSPVVALAVTALVLGFERQDLRDRFGLEAIHIPLISLPPDSLDPVEARHRLATYVLVGLPWAVAFEAVCTLGIPSLASVATLPFERTWPVLEWTAGIYESVYVFVLVTPFVVRTQRGLREVSVMGLIATAAVTFFYLTVPVVSPPRPFEPRTIFGDALMLELALCDKVAVFPSFHVIWSMIAAHGWAKRSRVWGIAGGIWAVSIAITCVTTGMHATADVVAAVVTFALLRQRRHIWERLRRGAEGIANSWHAWTWKGVRVINYAFYAALAGAVGFWMSNVLGGPQVYWPLVAIHVCGLLGAAAWAQQLEGSPALSRPFGYYGSVIGVAVGTIVAGWIAGNVTLLLAVTAMAAPWVQAIGRLRCLVQGCCHGAKASEVVGIRYRDPRSRVCALANLADVPLHPTPLYSMLANVVIGVVLLRLWSAGAAFTLVTGAYLMLAGITRFVEESLRGEPQTPVVGGLRLYQWLAVLSLVSGILVTTIPSGQPMAFFVAPDARTLIGGVLCGLVVGVAMGVDFPASARRFAHLAPPT
ncbi:MAG TPA: prolipoprotein diacylglyceryl transferase family protein [Thermoleophilia bacterium]|nr:prolipoprotein diacylglyceryl transferase family protein [Thermoleophilia bacterium]